MARIRGRGVWATVPERTSLPGTDVPKKGRYTRLRSRCRGRPPRVRCCEARGWDLASHGPSADHRTPFAPWRTAEGDPARQKETPSDTRTVVVVSITSSGSLHRVSVSTQRSSGCAATTKEHESDHDGENDDDCSNTDVH